MKRRSEIDACFFHSVTNDRGFHSLLTVERERERERRKNAPSFSVLIFFLIHLLLFPSSFFTRSSFVTTSRPDASSTITGHFFSI